MAARFEDNHVEDNHVDIESMMLTALLPRIKEIPGRPARILLPIAPDGDPEGEVRGLINCVPRQ